MESKYTLLERLGDGTYGEVWKGKSNSTGKIVAIKIQCLISPNETLFSDISD